jgi:hypothetical protein
MLKEMDKPTFAGCLPERECDDFLNKNFKVYADANLGNFSVVVIQAREGMFAGVSKRNPTDKPSDAGVCIAAIRAWRAYRGNVPGYQRQRPVSKRESKYAALRAFLLNRCE